MSCSCKGSAAPFGSWGPASAAGNLPSAGRGAALLAAVPLTATGRWADCWAGLHVGGARLLWIRGRHRCTCRSRAQRAQGRKARTCRAAGDGSGRWSLHSAHRLQPTGGLCGGQRTGVRCRCRRRCRPGLSNIPRCGVQGSRRRWATCRLSSSRPLRYWIGGTWGLSNRPATNEQEGSVVQRVEPIVPLALLASSEVRRV